MKVSKILKFVSLIIALIALYFFVQVSTNGDGKEGDVEALNAAVASSISYTYILLIITVIIVAFFMVLDVVKHPAKLKKTLIGVVAFLILFGIAYALAGDGKVEVSSGIIEKGSVLSKRVSTGIIFSFILGIIAFAGFIFDSVKSLLK